MINQTDGRRKGTSGGYLASGLILLAIAIVAGIFAFVSIQSYLAIQTDPASTIGTLTNCQTVLQKYGTAQQCTVSYSVNGARYGFQQTYSQSNPVPSQSVPVVYEASHPQNALSQSTYDQGLSPSYILVGICLLFLVLSVLQFIQRQKKFGGGNTNP